MTPVIRHIPPYLITLLTLAAICYFSLAPDPMPHSNKLLDFPGADKLMHGIMYVALTLAYCFDYYRRATHRRNERTRLIGALTTAIIIGGIIEILQHNMHMGRSGDIIDFIADAIGACTGIILGMRLFTRLSPLT